MKNSTLLANALALAAIGLGVAACTPSSTASVAQKPATADPMAPAPATAASQGAGSLMDAGSGVSTGPGSYLLAPMPAGTVQVERRLHGHLRVLVHMFGLTPGSSHQAWLDGPLGHPVQFTALTADTAGQATATLTSVDEATWLPPLRRLFIGLGDSAGEPIAESAVLPARPEPGAVYAFHAVTAEGAPAGRATIAYSAAAQTLTVTVTASGLNPGPHAAHIHLGSCQNQGPVKYMMPDFTADASGAITSQTRVITGVTSVPAPGAWYLNLHQGGMTQILANGAPTLAFRPLLCTDLISLAPAAAPATTPSTMPATMPTAMPTAHATTTIPATMPPAPGTTTMPPATPTPTSTPTTQPTHF